MLHATARALVISLAVTALPTIGASTAELTVAKAEPVSIEVSMINNPDGSQTMILSRSAVHKGPILFKVRNHSANMVHEFLVLRTDLAPSAFPMAEDGTRVDESKLKGIQEMGDLDPGKSGDMRVTLKPGRYVLFCNQPGHFKAGMLAVLRVTP